jgi:hypothetical protein
MFVGLSMVTAGARVVVGAVELLPIEELLLEELLEELLLLDDVLLVEPLLDDVLLELLEELLLEELLLLLDDVLLVEPLLDDVLLELLEELLLEELLEPDEVELLLELLDELELDEEYKTVKPVVVVVFVTPAVSLTANHMLYTPSERARVALAQDAMLVFPESFKLYQQVSIEAVPCVTV